WSPEDPYLYRFTLQSGEDTVRSYFALRTVTCEIVKGIPRLCLNGKPYFFHGLLDQGYFSDGIYLPASPEGYAFDVRTAKELGFNMLRKHIKIEPEEFYYQCDLQGIIVFQDMVNGGKYRYIRDTVLPTLGMKKRLFFRAGKKQRFHFEKTAKETVRLLQNHPSVCYYTVFNEGWGQYDADRIYKELKALDPSRIWDATSGWFLGRESDVDSRHVYFRPFRVGKRSNKPLVLSEFGGYTCKLEEHSFNLNKTYGYKTYTDLPAFRKGLESLYREQILPAVKEGLCGTVLTQLSDVEDETNGLVTYDRQVVKADPAAMAALAADLQKEMR
ncbi:MAG: glycoside hydrolase family 2, partial [Clostridia bacterium]|nr:glycoside hydrolase family 2 [Clostridia bacterium]